MGTLKDLRKPIDNMDPSKRYVAIDGDMICWHVGKRHSTILEFEDGNVSDSFDKGGIMDDVERMLEDILYDTECDDAIIFVSPKRNFRYDLYPEYKAHRKKKYKPKAVAWTKGYLKDVFSALEVSNMEADDALGIVHSERPDTVIASHDKDMKQMGGTHYRWHLANKSAKLVEITPEDGTKLLLEQTLKGDSSDNIKGAYLIGDTKAPPLVLGLVLAVAHGTYEPDKWTAFMCGRYYEACQKKIKKLAKTDKKALLLDPAQMANEEWPMNFRLVLLLDTHCIDWKNYKMKSHEEIMQWQHKKITAHLVKLAEQMQLMESS